MNAAYYDAAYLIELQCNEHGTAEVSAHAATVDTLCCSLHGRAEFASAAFRKFREGAATPEQYRALLAQLHQDSSAGHLRWLPVTGAIIDRVESVFATAPPSTNLRAADALHLACAGEYGFTEVHSKDRLFLTSSPPHRRASVRADGGECDSGLKRSRHQARGKLGPLMEANQAMVAERLLPSPEDKPASTRSGNPPHFPGLFQSASLIDHQ